MRRWLHSFALVTYLSKLPGTLSLAALPQHKLFKKNGAHSYMIETRLPPCLGANYLEKTGARSHVIVRADAALAAR